MAKLHDRLRSLTALLAGATAMAGLAGCVTPLPPSLDTAADETLAGPDLARLVAPAAALRHPVLKPDILDPAKPHSSDAKSATYSPAALFCS